MRKTETIALFVLYFYFCSTFIQGEHDSNSSAHIQSSTTPSTPSLPPWSATTQPEFLRPALVNASWEGDSTAMNSADTLGYPTEAFEPKITTPAPMKATSGAGNLTNLQDRPYLQDRENHTSIFDITLSTNVTTSLPKEEPKTGTAVPSTPFQTSRITTSSHKTTTEIRVTTRGRSASTTSITTSTTTQSTETSSTPVLAKPRVDTPSELNVGDNIENTSTTMDPLLAGLVSVFVVTAGIVALLIFLKFRHRNERPEFRRLQDLPMDDMMEDTPLSMYSY